MTPTGLTEAVSVTEGQDYAVLAVYARYPYMALPPSEVHRIMASEGRSILLTSVRRSINTLLRGWYIERVKLVDGPWGRPEWALRLNPTRLTP
jgi:hypothetical protein